ncbi:MAG TPA: hypothetical protein VMU60_05760 [Syntrophobacteria bacterium]|nr:hypothetical protein [Syntrophobacteria bacterium]
MPARKRRKGERCEVCGEWRPDSDEARSGACLRRAALFQMADCFFGYQITEGYEVLGANHWCERFRPRENGHESSVKAGRSRKG